MKPIFFILLSITYLFSWDNAPHMVIAIIAQKNLNKNATKETKHLVKVFNRVHHTNYNFATLATFLDADRKRDTLKIRDKHYVTIYYYANSGHFSHRVKRYDALVEILKNMNILKRSHNDIKRANALAVLLHLIGDINQPLHVYTLKDRRFRYGDKGGNFYKLKGKYKNLHKLYDSGAMFELKHVKNGDVMALKNFIYKNKLLSYKPKKLSDNIYSYMYDERKYIKKIYSIVYNGYINKTYFNLVRSISYRQMGYAGYRLAYILNELLATC